MDFLKMTAREARVLMGLYLYWQMANGRWQMVHSMDRY